MQIIKPSYLIETPIDRNYILKFLERAARTCYKSECKITENSASGFVRKLVHVKKHQSIIEHFSLTVRFIIDTGISHEIVRHRLAAYSQESSRYCNYSDDKFGGEITVIKPCFWEETSPQYKLWKDGCQAAQDHYFHLLGLGATPQEARSVLPKSLKTEIVCTWNLRELRHILTLRTSSAAHPQMREIMIPLLNELKEKLPEIFDDIEIK